MFLIQAPIDPLEQKWDFSDRPRYANNRALQEPLVSKEHRSFAPFAPKADGIGKGSDSGDMAFRGCRPN